MHTCHIIYHNPILFVRQIRAALFPAGSPGNFSCVHSQARLRSHFANSLDDQIDGHGQQRCPEQPHQLRSA